MEYRKRLYDSYVSSHFGHHNTFSPDEYELYSKIAKRRYRRILPEKKDAAIADAGCGAGHFLYFLQKEGYFDLIGIDSSEEQLAVARKAGIHNLLRADLFEYLPKCGRSFDMIIANDIIEHLNKDETIRFLDLVYGALLPGGRVLVSTLNAGVPSGRDIQFSDFTHEQGFTVGSLCQVLRACNFTGVEAWGEKPVAHDLRSSIRAALWACAVFMRGVYAAIEGGTGRGLRKGARVFEPRIYAVGYKAKP
jgi:2-polyprenyl-3-methyl-5-hydroxy-6-metoxy-1,4-benzoquinol methylase